MSFAILVDSTLEFPDDFEEYVEIIPLHIRIGDRVFKDREIEVSKLFELMREENTFAKTSQPSPSEFEEVYSRLLEKHDHVLSIHISSKLSGTISSASVAARKFEGKVRIFDSQTSSIGAIPLIEKAISMMDRSIDEVVAELKRLREKTKLLILVMDTEFLRLSGRVSNLKHLIGSMMRIKPIIDVRNGELVVEKMALGVNKAIKYLKDRIKRAVGKIVVGHILNEDLAEKLVEFSRSLGKDTRMVEVKSSVLSAHLGPESVGVLIYED